MRVATIKRQPTPAELLIRRVGAEAADLAFRTMMAGIVSPAAKRAACRRLNRLTAVFIAEDEGQGHMHGALAGSAAVAAPAYTNEPKHDAEAMFRRRGGGE